MKSKEYYKYYVNELKKEFQCSSTKALMLLIKNNTEIFVNENLKSKIDFIIEFQKEKNREKVLKWKNKNKELAKKRNLYYQCRTYIAKEITKQELISLIKLYNARQILEEEKIKIK